jgi:FMN phosphatase YigB (HAD superfamily)
MVCIFLDVDYTLVRFDHTRAVEEVAKIDEVVAKGMDRIFNEVINDNVSEKLRREIRNKQMLLDIVPDTNHATKWSREIWCMIVSDDYGLDLSTADIVKISNAYWKAIEERQALYPDAKRLLEQLKDRDIFLLTGSDGRLRPLSNRLIYDSTYSRMMKMNRLDKTGLEKYYKDIFICDPLDKPGLDVFKQALYQAGVPASEAVMIGDSYDHDIVPAKAVGMKTILLTRRSRYPEDVSSADHAIESLEEVADILKL